MDSVTPAPREGALDPRDAALLLSIAEAATPAGRIVPAPGPETVARVEAMLARFGPSATGRYAELLRALDLAALPLAGRRLSSLSAGDRQAVLTRLAAGPGHWLVRAATAPIKYAQARRDGVLEALGHPRGASLPLAEERRRWEERVVDARTLTDDEELEVDAVVVGTGAGGGPVARTLASRGHAVLMLEEGSYFTRRDFTGRALDMQLKLFRPEATVTLGNTVIPVPIGRTVGGTTTINSGTCFRLPEAVMRRWRFDDGLVDLDPDELGPYFERVESMLRVEPARPEVLGGCARVVARGCEALGWAHEPLHRNAPDCDGQGVCAFGCPTDAKRSTNVSYVPAALEAGAMLFSNARVTRVLVEGGRAVGVVAEATRASGRRARITVRARTVVLACGALHTPALLLRQGLANGNGRVGRDLTIHPASYAWALMDEEVRGWEAIPQGYSVDQFVSEGIRLEGVFLPLDMAAATMWRVGRAWTDVVDRFDRLASFGFMIAESSRGRVVLGPGGKPQMRYVMNDADRRLMVRGQAILARLFLAAGARAVYPGLTSWPIIVDAKGAERLERLGPAKVKARHIEASAYHPLGTCRMGADPRRSVVGPTHETHEVPGLFVCDGSTVNGPLGVNPQITIMALSERAATFVERRIESDARTRVGAPGVASAAAAGPEPAAGIEFVETMAGTCRMRGDDREVATSFTVRAAAEDAGDFGRAFARSREGLWDLEGTLTMEGVADAAPCRGTLAMRPTRRRGTLVYDLSFEAADGTPLRLYGQKHVGALSALTGMTTLHTEVLRAADHVPIARGTLRFDLKDLVPWLATWRVRSSPAAATGAEPPRAASAGAKENGAPAEARPDLPLAAE